MKRKDAKTQGRKAAEPKQGATADSHRGIAGIRGKQPVVPLHFAFSAVIRVLPSSLWLCGSVVHFVGPRINHRDTEAQRKETESCWGGTSRKGR